ncbi:MAG: exodeoxyribonuclease VII large subunit [Anaerolineales bacterium]|nr:exodeoxyribonuclease VII large subunit [Anaerolineales bacterium]
METQLSFRSPGAQWSVAELTNYLRELFESDRKLHDVAVIGEVSNISRPRSGHMYFSLTDGKAALQCVMWRSDVARLVLAPQDGERMVAYGNVSVYAASGRYQLYVNAIQLAGEGELLAQLEVLKRKLAAEGLFDLGHKSPLPALPERIAVVTSPTGAAFQDIKRVLARRWPLAQISLFGTAVQGTGASMEMVAALQAADELHLDVILLARGGGAAEDLWAFNNEEVVRAVAATTTPLVTGIGHETDFTLADLASDLRAATPSAAAEIATPHQRELRQELDRQFQRLSDSLRVQIQFLRAELRELEMGFRDLSPQVQLESVQQRLHHLSSQVFSSVRNSIELRRRDVFRMEQSLSSLGIEATLARGYAVVTNRFTGEILREASALTVGEVLDIRLYDGGFSAEVVGIHRREQ